MFFSLRLWAAYRWVAWSEKTSCTSLLEWVITLTFIQGFSTVRTITYMQWADWVDLSHNGDEILPGKSKTVSIFLDRHWPHLQIRFVWLFSPWPLPRLVKSQSSQLTRILKGSNRDRDKYYSMIKEKRGHLCHIEWNLIKKMGLKIIDVDDRSLSRLSYRTCRNTSGLQTFKSW